jgi:hypothetical protein
MSFNEHIDIEEEAYAYIKYPDGHVEKITIKTKHDDKGLLWNLAKIFGLVKEPGTVTDYGRNAIAGLLGNVAGYYPINKIGAYDGSGYNWMDVSCTVSGIGSLLVSNSLNPWSGGKSYTKLYLNNTIEFGQYHSTIDIAINLTGAASLSWWADITYRFT